MGLMGRLLAAVLLLLSGALVPACAQEAGHPQPRAAETVRGCLTQKERRAAVESGAVIRLANALHVVKSRMAGTLVRARLCRRHDGLVYVLTVLAHDGKVVRFTVDAAKGTLLGAR